MVTRTRVRAPELRGRGWLNTGGVELSLADLRGRVVVLDFWTFCCVNCLHVLDELRPLEERFADSLVLVGVHSPKFEHEADPDALAAAVERYAVHHPVLDDPELVTWQAYTARAWPTLVVVDPEGYIVASMSGEGHAHGLSVLVEELVEEHRAKGTLRVGNSPYAAPPPARTALRFPGKAVGLPDGSFLVSDTTHHDVVWLEGDLESERRRFATGSGVGRLDEPQGLLLLPDEVARRVGYEVVVADSVNHQVKGLRLADGTWTLLAGTGRQLRERSGGGLALTQDLSTPWDVAWFLDRVVVAMAGTHQLWALHLASDPTENTVAVLAGTSAEGIRDGVADEAWFAQPSGLAAASDGTRLWVADSETSALRSLDLTPAGFTVTTHVGRGLFDFGHRDGAADDALFQHPLGVTVLPDGSVAVSDTYNGAIRRFDPVTAEVSTLATGLEEPSAAWVERDSGAEGSGQAQARLVVVESAAHQLVRIPLPDKATRVDGLAHQTQRPRTPVAGGPVRLEVTFTPPTGQKLDHRWGDPTRLMVSATPEALLRAGGGGAPGLARDLVLDPAVGDGVLHVSVQAASCDGDPVTGEVPEHAACHLYQQDWGIPVVLSESGTDTLTLDLRGTT